jgi:hypothetical protein
MTAVTTSTTRVVRRHALLWRIEMPYHTEKASLQGEAHSNLDLLGGEIKKNITLKQVNRQHRLAALPQRISDLYARLPLALDDKTHPILTRNWPMDTKRQILRMIRSEMKMTGGHHA